MLSREARLGVHGMRVWGDLPFRKETSANPQVHVSARSTFNRSRYSDALQDCHPTVKEPHCISRDEHRMEIIAPLSRGREGDLIKGMANKRLARSWSRLLWIRLFLSSLVCRT